MPRKMPVLTEHEIDKAAAVYFVSGTLDQIAHRL